MDLEDTFHDQIYEAAVVPEMWPAVLDRLAQISGAIGGLLLAFAPPSKSHGNKFVMPMPRWTTSASITERISAFIAEGWLDRNCRAERAVKLDHAGFLTDLDLFTPEELVTEPFYHKVRDMGFGYCAGTTILPPCGDALIFDLERRHEDGPPTRAEMASLDRLRPDLARAALMSSRLGLEKARVASETLALLGLPAAVLSTRSTMLAANALLQDLMPTIVDERAGGRMHLVDAIADRMFQTALVQANLSDHRQADLAARVLSIPLPATHDRAAMVAHVLPLRRAARDVFAIAATVVLVTPVCPSQVPSATVIQGLFDLTAAEARVARRLTGGDSIGAIAASSQTSEMTVRTQLRSIFEKTGVCRQVDLVSLLGNINPVRTTL